MTLWDNLRKKITTIIDLPIEAVQSSHPRLAPSGITPQTQYSYTIPKAIPKNIKTRTLREAPSNAYTHGLEKIYSLETVDPKTIRVLKQDASAKTEKKLSSTIEGPYTLDFGPGYREWITPCYWKEPIQVLGLSTQAEKMLLSQGWKTIKDVMDVDSAKLVHIKGFGQGHIDELAQKLQNHIGTRGCRFSEVIEWTAWVRSILHEVPAKEAKIVAEMYGFSDAIQVAPYQSGEIRRLRYEEKKEIARATLANLKQSGVINLVRDRWTEILQAFVLPWARRRKNLVQEEEIIERLETVGENAQHGISLLKDLLGHDRLYNEVFHQVDSKLYAVDNYTAMLYEKVCGMAQSYFYKPQVSYFQEELANWILRELVKDWIECDISIIEKYLTYSPQFRTYRDQKGKKFAALAWDYESF